MTRARRQPERGGLLAGALAGLARQFELPFFGSGAPQQGVPTEARGRGSRNPVPLPEPSVTNVADPRQRHIQLEGRTLHYTFRRARRKTIGLSITASGLTVSAPRWVGMGQVEDAIREREQWVLTKLADMQRHHAAIPQVRWEDGGTLPYLGAPMTLAIASHDRRVSRTAFDRETRVLTLSLPPEPSRAQIRDRVEAWLQDEARLIFQKRLAYYEARLGTAHRVLRLSSARTRWGSCSADGRILLNWRLIHFPLSSIDYVVAHELAHLKEMNHGPRFWATVAELLPDYETAREQVKHPPPELMPTL
jgi:predicted metal-dependent hydrolase